MLLNKLNLDVVKFAANEGSNRPGLAGVHITGAYTEATNGHVMVRVTTPKVEASEFPTIEGFDATTNGKECVLPADAAKALSKAIPKSRTLPILSHVAWDAAASTEDRLAFAVTDLSTVQRFDPRPIEGPYPTIDNIIPKHEPKLVMAFNGQLLGDALKFVGQDGGLERNYKVRLEFYGTARAVVLKATNPDTEQEITALVMPLRLEQ